MRRSQPKCHMMATETVSLSPEGDCAVRVQFGDAIDNGVNAKVHAFCHAVEQAGLSGVVEWVPAYSVATIYYRPEIIRYDDLRERIIRLALAAGADPVVEESLIEIPVAYGGDFGPDLADVARRAGLAENEVTAIHCGTAYRCYMVGFMPGFPYLGEVAAEIRTPRLATPRVRVPAGSVAIADTQTGIYPRESPGGWNLIGRTPLALFDPQADSPALVAPGDYVRFVPIEPTEYAEIADSVACGEYFVHKVPY